MSTKSTTMIYTRPSQPSSAVKQIFVVGVDVSCQPNRLEDYLRGILKSLGIFDFHCIKPRGKPIAFLTLAEAHLVAAFLQNFGYNVPRTPSTFAGKQLKFFEGRNYADPVTLDLLRNSERYRLSKHALTQQRDTDNRTYRSKFRLSSLECGFWDYEDGSLVFVPTYADDRNGSIILGRSTCAILLESNRGVTRTSRIDINYSIVDSIAHEYSSGYLLTLSMTRAPQFSEQIVHDPASQVVQTAAIQALSTQLQSLTVGVNQQPAPPQPEASEERIRVSGVSGYHQESSGSCFVYRLAFFTEADLKAFQESLGNKSWVPRSNHYETKPQKPQDFKSEYQSVLRQFSDVNTFASLPFSLKFQLQKMVQNGYLPPRKTISLMPHVETSMKQFGETSVRDALCKVMEGLPFAGPHTLEKELSVANVASILKSTAQKYSRHNSLESAVRRHEHLQFVYRVTITPAGEYLEGPLLETKNRVLRSYRTYPENFIRVTFYDEDLHRLSYNSHISHSKVHHDRFRRVLDNILEIAGKKYSFLGFSNSSLRSQQVWFLAPFVQEGRLYDSKNIIKVLGDFDSFRSPARCAARIGQAFSDTTHSIVIPSEAVTQEDDIKRGNRVFSDGCGRISQSLLDKVSEKFKITRKGHATVLQIRFRGAKGMLVLDPTLKGQQLCLRPSMVKFEGTSDPNLEICGAGYKARLSFLNQQSIKILEDLGVPSEAFLNLQRQAMTELQNMTESSINAAKYLEVNTVGTAARLPSLIRMLHNKGLNFREDEFLRKTVDMASIFRLRHMKYRARIPIPQSLTLYGVVDETNELEANEIYVTTRDKDGRKHVLVRNVIITRSPALHPGDIRCVNAVDVSPDSPLRQLHNCVVFSQKGERDLPSMLSGGDLDGDMYNVIYEDSLWPKIAYNPADYIGPEPTDIGRRVEPHDVKDFFMEFMANDQLGRISKAHQQIADQKSEGTFASSCLELAEMHSTAVDFAKTGIAPDIEDMPRDYDMKRKPDFMAPLPRLLLDPANDWVVDEEYEDPDILDPIRLLDGDARPITYYESQKALGKLYRDIDEKQFLTNLNTSVPQAPSDGSTVMGKLWDFVQRENIMLDWPQYLGLAREIRDAYEQEIADTAYQYSSDHSTPLAENEVFAGVILGKDGRVIDKGSRGINYDMKDDFSRRVKDIIHWITSGDADAMLDVDVDYVGEHQDLNPTDVLERCVACLHVAMEEPTLKVDRMGQLVSFKYVVAALCLEEMKRKNGGVLPKTLSE